MRRFLSVGRTLVAATVLSVLTLPAAPAANAISSEVTTDTRVSTADGQVEGFIKDGVAQFRGIPFAAPPVGKLRWRPPAAPAKWSGVRDATQFRNICLQVTTLGPFAGPANANEDCLYLNVYTPSVHPASHQLLPVLVWIHGGGNLDGGSNDYDGSKLATQGNLVVVTINYRLGLLGFMSHPAIDAEGHLFSDYGILDQQAALRWVQANIRNFGGDAGNVTLGGQSAGSVDTEANMISPLAKGLFHRAIFESALLEPVPLPTAEANGVAFAVAAGCGSGTDAATAACLRYLSAQDIFNLSGTPSTQAPYVTQITIDGTVLPGRFTALIENGQFTHMPVLSGWVEDEQNFALGITEFFSGPPRVPASETDYNNRIAAFGTNPAYPPGTQAQAKSVYPLSNYTSPQLALDAIGTDATACTQRHTNQLLAPQVRLYEYEFDDRTAPSYFPDMPGFQPLAYHTSDIQYLFPGWHGGPQGIAHALNSQQEFLSDELVEAWSNFARSGNPNGHGNSPWPRLRDKANNPGVLSESLPNLFALTDAELSERHKCVFWDSISNY
jgi:para-nitrobenzyl esterase